MEHINKQIPYLNHQLNQFTSQNFQILSQNDLLQNQHLIQIFKTFIFSHQNTNTSKFLQKHSNNFSNTCINLHDLNYKTSKKGSKSQLNTHDNMQTSAKSTFWNRFNKKLEQITTKYEELQTEMLNKNYHEEEKSILENITQSKQKSIEKSKSDYESQTTKQQEQENYETINQMKTVKKRSSQGSNICSNQISISFISNRVPLMNAPKKTKKFVKIRNLSKQMRPQAKSSSEYQPCSQICVKQSPHFNKQLFRQEKV